MKSTPVWTRLAYVFLSSVIVFLLTVVLFADPPADGNLKVMKMGLGSGLVTSNPAGINCGTDCEKTFPASPSVQITASPDPGSTFVGWDVDQDADPTTTPDCPGATNPCTLTMNAHRSVRPVFQRTTPIPPMRVFDTSTGAPSTRVYGPGDFLNSNEVIRPEDIQAYLDANTDIDSAPKFIAALPPEFKQHWLLMSRSESLQIGTAEMPRILLPSRDARFVFTVGMREHSSYPGGHRDAIEYMQWDATQKNFRFHEIVLNPIGLMDSDNDGIGVIPARPRKVSVDDDKCSKCHSTRNVQSLDRSVTPHVPGPNVGTDGDPPGSVQTKNKPNWDAYDSWGGMLPFNRDRIYQGSVEAAAFRKLFNPWTWRTNDFVRQIIEQLKLQPTGTVARDLITRRRGGLHDGHVNFGFDPMASRPVLIEPSPSPASPVPDPSIPVNYAFDRAAGTGAGSNVVRGGDYVMLRHTIDVTSTVPDAEGRGVEFFDHLGGLNGTLNQTRIADELVNHHFAPGNKPIDVRPITLALSQLQPCLSISGSNVISNPAITPALPALRTDLSFFNQRNGMTIDQIVADTTARVQSVPRRKADIQKLNADRTGDVYVTGADPAGGEIQQYGSATAQSTDVSLPRIRQEVFRRPLEIFGGDSSVLGGIYVDREAYSFNINRVALYRYFLEPLGVSVDKWSMGVRGRSRTYSFADVFGTYRSVFVPELEASLGSSPDCAALIPMVNNMIDSLPEGDGPMAIPNYTDVQRIFNKSCIECHGGLDYPPYQDHGGGLFDLSENETPPTGQDRLDRSHGQASGRITSDPRTSFLYQRICPGAGPMLPDPNTPCPVPTPGVDNENCPYGIMPCGGPRLSHADIATIRRWIIGGAPNTRGDPHIQTINGVNYDFQSAGEFVLLRGENLEIQSRQVAIETSGPLGPNGHTGLRSCPSLNNAAAVKVGPHRITYQPNLSGQPDPEGMQLRLDGKETRMTPDGILLQSGGRIIPTTAQGGIQIEAPGGTVIVVTPGWWDYYQVWYLNIDVRHARATEGVMGVIAPGNWLPALPDGTSLGPRPRDLHQRYVDLYEKFETAWRVTDQTTLFDYAPGTSTASFTIESWPIENPQQCTVPMRVPSGPISRTPPQPLSAEQAQQHCAAIVDGTTRTNCIADVMATGEPKFAETYLRGQQIERNGTPAPPVLGFPAAFKTDVTLPLDFTWDRAADRDGDPVTYKHCVWDVKEPFHLSKCIASTGQTTTSFRSGRYFYPLLILLLGLLLLLLLFFLGFRRRPWVLAVIALIIVAGVVLAFYLKRGANPQTLTARSASTLQAGRAYYWKVIVEDGKGGTVESETRRFDVVQH
ncbi:MAG TPA: hypothetical protein VFR78_20635 [Pyrinomonadaceae bacterium]|nr:hypothetical protein [Pyrinomonadaceae bacterium]